jgi:hypothetical protein
MPAHYRVIRIETCKLSASLPTSKMESDYENYYGGTSVVDVTHPVGGQTRLQL